MENCGYIMSRGSNYESLLMRCSFCTIDVEIEKWQEFVLHFRNSQCSGARISSKCVDIEQVLLKESCVPEELECIKVEAKEVDTKFKVDSEEEISRSCSSLSVDASLSDNESDTAENASDSNTQSENEEGNKSSLNSPSYTFVPSFFRKDPRTMKFIKSYENQPCLWNPGHNKYKDTTACKAAYQQLITELESKTAVLFSEHSLKIAIKKLHIQFNTVETRLPKPKPNSVASNHYKSCSFLRACKEQVKEQVNTHTNGKFQLDFSKRNKLTTDFIQLYAEFPELYDSKHSNFSNMNCRKQAFTTMTDKTLVSDGDINIDDIYLAVQSLRHWYYKRTRTRAFATGNESEKFYIKACAFLPPKMFKQKLLCEICQHETFSDPVLQAHMYKMHNIGELPFKCLICERSFASRAELATHSQRVHIGKTHKCNSCDKSFAVHSDLRLHMRTHSGNNILCELCGKAFRLKSQMNMHVTTIHTKIRAFKCTMCPKDFLKKVHLSDHIKSHLNIRDKICATCGKGFTSSHSLIRHRQIHSEVKKFVCKLCDSRFSQFVGLNSHMKRTHNIVRDKALRTTDDNAPEQSIS